MPNDPRFEVEDDTIKDTLRQIAKMLDGAITDACEKEGKGRRLGFGLFIFEFTGPAFFWISNADRGDMRKALREWMQREGDN
jgi:hypothetical protein